MIAVWEGDGLCIFTTSVVHVFSQLQQSCSELHLLRSFVFNTNVLVSSGLVVHQETPQGLLNATAISVFWILCVV